MTVKVLEVRPDGVLVIDASELFRVEVDGEVLDELMPARAARACANAYNEVCDSGARIISYLDICHACSN